MTSVGACLIANEPDSLGAKIVQRRIEGKNWTQIKNEFNLSSKAARHHFKLASGITDYKAKGPYLKQLIESTKGMAAGDIKAAATAVKEVDAAIKPATTVVQDLGKKAFDIDKANKDYGELVKAVDGLYGDGTALKISDAIKNGDGYLAISQKTGVAIKDIDALNFQKLLIQTDGDVWKAYKLKPSSENGFQSVKNLVNDARSKGMTNQEISLQLGVPDTVVDAIEKDTWKIAGPGSKTPNIPLPPPPPAAEFSMTEPLSSGGNFEFQSKAKWDKWHETLGPDLTSHELDAVRAYTGSSYRSINSSLRGGRGHDLANAIDRAMRPTPFDAQVIRKTGMDAFRSLGVHSRADFEKLVARTFEDDGYMSTAIEHGHWGGDVEMIINVPKGTKARWVDPVSRNKGERELLLGRKQPMVITRVVIPTHGAVKLYCTII